MNLIAQSFTGAKTFLSSLVASAGITLTGALQSAPSTTLRLQGDLGLVGSDVVVKAGTSVADGSVNSSAKLFTVRTGIGATEVDQLIVRKGGVLALSGSPLVGGSLVGEGTAAVLALNNSVGAALSWNDVSLFIADGANASVIGANAVLMRGNVANGPTASANEINSSSVLSNLAANLTAWKSAGALVARVSGLGMFGTSGTDTSGTPGAATVNKPSGVAAIAGGATTCVITNSLMTTATRVDVTWLGDLGTQTKIPWVTRANGSFTVNVGTAPVGAVSFGWELKGLI